MGVLLSLIASCQLIADSAGARPDHPISGRSRELDRTASWFFADLGVEFTTLICGRRESG
jgi:hypothetical protein